MLKASQRAFILFEDKLAAREEPGRQIETPRALFDLWIDAAEEAYAEIALSPEFRRAYADPVDAQMRVRAGLQGPVEQVCATLGMPPRTEADAAHRKIVELERALRRLRDAVEGGPGAAPAAAGGAAAKSSARKPSKGAGKAAGDKSKSGAKAAAAGSGKAGSDKAGSGKGASGKRASGKATVAKPSKSAAAPAKRAARKLAPRPSVSARRAPTNGFSSHIPIPDAPQPPDPAPASNP